MEKFDQFSTLKNDIETQNFEIFQEVVAHNFGKSDGDNGAHTVQEFMPNLIKKSVMVSTVHIKA